MSSENIQISNDEIHLWSINPNEYQDRALPECFQRCLSPDEIKKYQRYIDAHDQQDALITRVFVRHLLSLYLDLNPAEIEFIKGDKDKPEIFFPEGTQNTIPLRFNLSHTKGLIICAVALTHDVGCDVERLDRKSDVLKIADRYFSESEIEELFSLPESNQKDRFFDYWTLKESYIKAWGDGLAIPLGDFTFHIGQSSDTMNNNIKLSFSEQRNDNPEDWNSWLLNPDENYQLALSIRTPKLSNIDYTLRYFKSNPLVSYTETTHFMF